MVVVVRGVWLFTVFQWVSVQPGEATIGVSKRRWKKLWSWLLQWHHENWTPKLNYGKSTDPRYPCCGCPRISDFGDVKVKWWSQKPLYFCKVSMLTKGNLLCFCRSVASLCTSPTDNKRTWQAALMSSLTQQNPIPKHIHPLFARQVSQLSSFVH